MVWTWLLECADGSYYAGHTDELDQRYAQHRSGEPKCYTSGRLPVRLVWSQDFTTRDEALAAERQVQGWSRKKKQALIRGDWAEIQRLAWGTKNPLPDRLLQAAFALRYLGMNGHAAVVSLLSYATIASLSS